MESPRTRACLRRPAASTGESFGQDFESTGHGAPGRPRPEKDGRRRNMSAFMKSSGEESEKGGPSALVRDHLFASRTVLIFGEVTTALAESVSAQLLALAERNLEPIRVVIHSPGGHVEAADTIHDVIRFIQPPVRMLGTGWVASAG